jgi:hypothetical protein
MSKQVNPRILLYGPLYEDTVITASTHFEPGFNHNACIQRRLGGVDNVYRAMNRFFGKFLDITVQTATVGTAPPHVLVRNFIPPARPWMCQTPQAVVMVAPDNKITAICNYEQQIQIQPITGKNFDWCHVLYPEHMEADPEVWNLPEACKLSVDINQHTMSIIQLKRLRRVLRRADLLFLREADLLQFGASPRAATEWLFSRMHINCRRPKTIISHRAEGCTVFTSAGDNLFLSNPTFVPGERLNTLGAGDYLAGVVVAYQALYAGTWEHTIANAHQKTKEMLIRND